MLVKVGVFFFKTIMIDVLDILKRLQKAKIDNKQEPAIVSMVEVQQEALKMTLEELRLLTREGEIKYHQTLNGHAFSIKEERNERNSIKGNSIGYGYPTEDTLAI